MKEVVINMTVVGTIYLDDDDEDVKKEVNRVANDVNNRLPISLRIEDTDVEVWQED